MEHNADNFSLEVIQKATENAEAEHSKRIEAQIKQRLRLIKQGMMEDAEKCKTSHNCHFNRGIEDEIVKGVEHYFLNLGFKVTTVYGYDGERLMTIDWAKEKVKEPTKRSSFLDMRSFFKEGR